MDEHHSWYNESLWHRHWPLLVYVGQWPIFYGPVILLHILKTIWWRNFVFGIMDKWDAKIDLVKYMWVSDIHFMVHWFCLISCHRVKLFLYFKKWRRPGVFVPLLVLLLVVVYIVANSNGTGLVRLWKNNFYFLYLFNNLLGDRLRTNNHTFYLL